MKTLSLLAVLGLCAAGTLSLSACSKRLAPAQNPTTAPSSTPAGGAGGKSCGDGSGGTKSCGGAGKS